MFCWTKDDLNKEQDDAVREDGNIFLIACPGSGKTRTLTYKIAYELSKLNSDKKYVIALTYTNRAADEIKERIETLGVSTKKLWIGTIHSFCLEWILRPYSLYHDDLKSGFRLLNSHDTEKIVTDICKTVNSLPRVTFWDCGYYVATTGYKYACTDTRKQPYVYDILSRYFKTLKENNQIDFEMILKYSYELLSNNKTISVLLSNLFEIILVDEYQDTKEVQYAIVSSILRESQGTTRSFIVGDPNQAIYQSLGGYAIDPDHFAKTANITQKKLSLSRNYRSSKVIVDYFSNYNVHSTKVVSHSKHKNFPSIISYENNISKNDIVDEIGKIIKGNIVNKDIEPSEICVVAPWWAHLASITRSLVASMPEYSFNGPGLVPFARDVENFWYKLSKIVLTEPSPKMYIRRLRWAKDVLIHLDRVGVDVSKTSSKQFLRISNDIHINKTDGMDFLKEYFKNIFTVLNIDIFKHQELKEHYNAFVESSNARIQRLQREGTPFINDIESFKKVFKPKEGITVSTIHGVKGAEFDTVIAFGLLEGMVPHFSDTNGKENSKKMLYVISSRARKHLHLISENDRERYGGEVYPPTNVLFQCKYIYKKYS